MLLIEITEDGMKLVTEEPTDGTWFRHESPYRLTTLKPLTYDALKKKRPDYDIAARKETEEQYHKLLDQSENTSFLYATVVGFNKMETPEQYPGFTYYFKLGSADIAKCLFGIEAKSNTMKPEIGSHGLAKAMKIWEQEKDNLKSYQDKELGKIDPRIEVIIPFQVKPSKFFPQKEDR